MERLKATKTYHGTYLATKAIFKATGVEINAVGQENIPEPEEGYILACTHHSSWWDVIATGIVMYEHNRRPIRFMAKDKFFGNRILGPLFRGLGAFPINREQYDSEQIQYAVDLLDAGNIVGIPPEGTRRYGDELAKTKRGVGIIACLAQTNILPVGIRGREWNIRQKRPMVTPPIDMAIGKAIKVEPFLSGQRFEQPIGNQLPRELIRSSSAITRDLRRSLQDCLDQASSLQAQRQGD